VVTKLEPQFRQLTMRPEARATMRMRGAVMKSPFLGVSAGALMFAAAAFGQKEIFVPPNDVLFTVTTERHTYTAGEQIYLKYKIVNISNGALYVPREWEAKCPSNPHVWAWFEDSSGKHFVPGYAGSCSPSAQTLTARMKKEAVLLKPGQRLEGTVTMDTALFGGLKPGAYRLEASLTGWSDKDFSQEQQSELEKMTAPFIRGEVPASTHITLQP